MPLFSYTRTAPAKTLDAPCGIPWRCCDSWKRGAQWPLAWSLHRSVRIGALSMGSVHYPGRVRTPSPACAFLCRRTGDIRTGLPPRARQKRPWQKRPWRDTAPGGRRPFSHPRSGCPPWRGVSAQTRKRGDGVTSPRAIRSTQTPQASRKWFTPTGHMMRLMASTSASSETARR